MSSARRSDRPGVPKRSPAASILLVAPGAPPLANVNSPAAEVVQCVTLATPTPTSPGQQHNDQCQHDEKDQPTWHDDHLAGLRYSRRSRLVTQKDHPANSQVASCVRSRSRFSFTGRRVRRSWRVARTICRNSFMFAPGSVGLAVNRGVGGGGLDCLFTVALVGDKLIA